MSATAEKVMQEPPRNGVRRRLRLGAQRIVKRPTQGEIRLIVKIVLAGTLAWWLCTRLGAPRPLFAVLVPLVAMDGDAFSAVSVSLLRTVGVFVGVFLGLAVIQLDLSSTALVAVLLLVTLAVGLLVRARNGPLNNQIAITAMFMLYLGAAAHAQRVGLARIWETAVGAAVAVAVAALVWPPDPVAEARRRVSRLRRWLREDLTRAAELLRNISAASGGAEPGDAGPDGSELLDAAEAQLERVRARSLDAVQDVLDLARGEQALRLNPRRRRDRQGFALQRARLERAARQYRHLRTITRILADAADGGPPLPAADCAALLRTLEALTASAAAATDPPDIIDPGVMRDPRAVGIALKLRQMIDDLAPADEPAGARASASSS